MTTIDTKDKALQDHIAVCTCNNSLFPLNFRKELNLLGDLGLDGWWDWHIKEDFEYMSPNFWLFLGYDPETKKHHPSEWQAIINKDDMAGFLIEYQKHIETNGEYPCRKEVRYTCADGSIKWILCRGAVVEWDSEWKPVRMVGTHTDVTEIKKRETDLYEEKQAFKSIFTHCPNGMALVAKDGKFIDVNDRFSDMLGFSISEFKEKTYMDITHPDDLEQDNSLVQKLLAGEISYYRMEKRYITKDHKIFWVCIHVGLIFSLYEEPVHFVVTIEDINEQKSRQTAVSKTIVELKEYLEFHKHS